jgi:transcriptional regulator with XRE-family HTH domain
MASFGELLTEYMTRMGISDSELARSLGISRQTIFRWKEGLTARPRLGMLLLLIGVAAAMVTVAFVALPSTAQNLGAWVVPPTARAARHPARGTQSV